MKADVVLVTGGAGFVGSHLVDRLVSDGYNVRVLDSVEPQVHGETKGTRNEGASYIDGNVLDVDVLNPALEGVGSVVHLAAQVGVGQSMYEIERYVRENTLGTAVLLERLVSRHQQLASFVVASSMSIYGEGAYWCAACRDNTLVSRHLDQLSAGDWTPRCRRCGGPAEPRPTPESKPLECDSVYAVTKRDHEELSLVFGRAYGVRTVALRFFNVYGTRQSLSNPYTGVGAIFASRLLNGAPPLVFEDGHQSRDFVHVSDVVAAIVLALEGDATDVALNIGTGKATTVLEVANTLAVELGVDVAPEVVGRFRHGDIRHCYPDITAARTVLGYQPSMGFGEGMRELAQWLAEEAPRAEDHVERATAELSRRGLLL